MIENNPTSEVFTPAQVNSLLLQICAEEEPQNVRLIVAEQVSAFHDALN